MPTIAILGSGSVGSALGRNWAGSGHDVRYGVRDEEKYAGLRDHATLHPVDEAVVGADVVVLALPFATALEALEGLGDLGDAVVVDATNPLDGDLRRDQYVVPSGSEVLAGVATGGRFVKAFASTGWEVMADASGFDPAPTLLVAGDDDAAVDVVAGLVRDLDLDPVRVGGLTYAREIEHLASLWIALARRRDVPSDVTISLQRREG